MGLPPKACPSSLLNGISGGFGESSGSSGEEKDSGHGRRR